MLKSLWTMTIASVACVVLLVLGDSASAVVINLDINNGASATYNGPGVAPSVGNYWNPATTPFPTGPLLASDGVTNTGATFSLTNFTNTYDNAGSPGFAPNLFFDFAYTTANTLATGATFSINNLTMNGLYDLYLYSLNGNGGTPTTYGNGASTTFSINGIDKTVINPTADQFSPSYAGFVEGGNYVKYSGLIAVGGTISGVFYDAAASASSLNGFQLVSIPEPSSALLLTIGMAGLIRAFRRRR